MEVYEAIKKRFSVRTYKDKPVENEKLMRVLEAGRLAPSGNNKQNWKFIVVADTALKAKLADAAEQPFVGTAPIIIAVVTNESQRLMSCKVPAAAVDCAIAVDHMTLTAVEQGLGTCWIGHFNQEKCKQLLNVPDDHQIIQLLLLGYPGCSQPPKNRKPIDDVICWNSFEPIKTIS